jgi:hypothetical protein
VIEVRVSKTVAADPDALRRLERPMLIARIVAEHVKRRVRTKGKTAYATPRYRTKGGYKTSSAYDKLAGVRVDDDSHSSSAAWHRAARKRAGTYDITGGMWSGLRVRNYGRRGAVIDFGGSTLGRERGKDARLDQRIKAIRERAKARIAKAKGKSAKDRARSRRDQQLAKARERARAKTKRVGNARKAGSVWLAHRVNVVQPTREEDRAILSAYSEAVARTTWAMIGGRVVDSRVTADGDRALRAKLTSALRRIR